jgi:uncharacterized delta-60 repeat protein
MSNHYHLVLETSEPNLVPGLAWLQGSYSIRLNDRHHLHGHMLSGRYKAQLVEGSGNGYLKTACDYVHLNPVRAGLLKTEERLLASRIAEFWRGFLYLFLIVGVIATRGQTLDSFNPGASGLVNALAIQADGKILVGGEFTSLAGQARSYIGRLNADGTLDGTFAATANGTVNCLVAQLGGGIIVGGSFTSLNGSSRNAIGRLTSSGTLDSFFDAGISASPNPAVISALAFQADGEILIAGVFRSVSFYSRTNLARLTAGGLADSTFNAALGSFAQNINSVALQSDGKVLAGGAFTSLGGQPRTNLARLNSNGNLDTGFYSSANGVVLCLAIQADGKILVGGNFTTLGGQACDNIGRLNSDGSFDTNFNPGASGSVSSIAIQTDGAILVAGSFTNLAGQPRGFLGRLNSDGTLDNGFNATANSNVLALAIQADGKIVIGGNFTNAAGQTRARVARLNNTAAAAQSLGFDGTNVTWLRGATSPEVWRTTFDLSTNGGNLSSAFGTPSRSAGGWQLPVAAASNKLTIRARGFLAGSKQNGSGSFVETNFGPPAITTQPIGRTANPGTAQSFGVGAAGSTGFTYQWRKNGTNLANAGNVSGAQSSALGLNNVFGAESGGYSCVVSNNYGSATSGVATLTVIDPLITAQPTNTIANLGATAFFSVGALGTSPVTYQWRKQGVALPGETSASLLWSNVQGADAGSYFEVAISNVFGTTTSRTAILTVNLASLDGFDAGRVEYGSDMFSEAIQTDGKIIVGGGFQKIGDYFFDSIARLNIDGTPEPGFRPPGGCCFGVHALALQTNGTTLAAGQVPSYLARLTTTGTWDASFDPAVAGPCAHVNCVVLQTDGKIIVGGSFNELGGQACTNLGRLNPDGSLDPSFHLDSAGSCSEVLCMALQPDGKILFGGQLGVVSSTIGRLNPNGTTDGSFSLSGPGSLYSPSSIVVQPDGKILVAAWFSKPLGQYDFLGRLNPDGTLDNAFTPGVVWSAVSGAAVHSMALQADGKILIGGQFTGIGQDQLHYIARLNSDGSMDHSFAPVTDADVYSLALQADGKIVLGGRFRNLNGTAHDYIGRLNNTYPAIQTLSFDAFAISWQRGGACPEVWRTTFEFSTNGINWVALGAGSRTPGGWQLPGVLLATNAFIRARGFVTGGQYNASTWFVENTLGLDPRTPPKILLDSGSFASNGFGFDVAGLQGQLVVVEGSTNFENWEVLATNSVGGSPFHFKDLSSVGLSARYYRARLR